MTSQAFAGVGTNIYRQAPVGGAWAALAEVKNISGPGMSRETIDVTSLASVSGWREFVSGFRDGGEVTLSMNMTNATYDLLLQDFNADSPRNFKIVLPDDDQSTFSFSALVTSLPLNVQPDDAVTVDVTLKVSGATDFYAGSTTTTTTAV